MLPKNSNISDSVFPKRRSFGKKKIFVGLSGGVDSAVSAALLKRAGYDVMGVFIKVWQPDFLPCTWRDERRDAMKVAIALDIPFLFFDFEKEYKKGVVDKMIAEYKVGRTPNPDILCNKEVKFGAFWQKAREMGADYIATGHYAQVSPRTDLGIPEVCPRGLRESEDKEKDQSYFLWTLTQDDLSHVLFPIGNLEKSEVRKLARGFNLPVSEKKDSQGICFVGDVSMDEFLSHFILAKVGRVLDTGGKIIGTHHGAVFYTIGERHGFEVLNNTPEESPFYIVSKDIKANTITVSSKKQEIISLSPTKVLIKEMNWITEPKEPLLSVRIRYRGEKLPVTVSEIDKHFEVKFREPVRGLSLGQSIVFYDEEICLGGGIMDTVVS